MGFQNKYYAKAVDLIAARKAANLRIWEERLAEMSAKSPDYARLNRELAKTGHELSMLFYNGSENISKDLADIEKRNLAIQTEMEKILLSFGKPADYLDAIYTCKKCGDTGFHDGARCECLEETAAMLAAKELNDSSPIKLSSFDSFSLTYYSDRIEPSIGTSARQIMSENFKFCKRYADNFHLPESGILMRGATGLGKTHLSLAIAADVIKKGYSVVYGSVPDLFRKVEKEHFSSSDDETLEILTGADLLILDDLGAEFESQFYSATLYNIINTRMNKGLPVIANTNLGNAEMQKRYSDRLVSRLKSYTTLVFHGSDVRLLRAQGNKLGV